VTKGRRANKNNYIKIAILRVYFNFYPSYANAVGDLRRKIGTPVGLAMNGR
jgi:hypothetical protein